MKVYLNKIILTTLVILFFASTASLAQTDIPGTEQPILTTSAGQSADVMTLNILMDEAGVLYDYCDVPTVELMSAGVGLGGAESGPGFHVEVKTDQSKYPSGTPYQTLVFAIGASMKGMGASGLTVDQELYRLKSLINYAQKNDIFIVAAHLGGLSKRGNPGSDNEKMIDAVVPYADFIVVTADGNKDGRFTELSKENDIPLAEVEYALDVVDVFKQVFEGEGE